MTTMTCPDPGTLRAYLDHEAPDHDALTAHVRTCIPCRLEIRTLRADAMLAASALDALGSGAIEKPSTTTASAAAGGEVSLPKARTRRLRALVAAASVGTVTLVTVGTPAGRAMASDVLDVFRSKEVVGIEMTAMDAQQTAAALADLGSVPTDLSMAAPQKVDSLEKAHAMVPFQIAQADAASLPAGVDATPDEIMVSKARDASFVFDEAKTRAYLASNGSDLAIPAGYNGTKLVITFPDAVALGYDPATANGKMLVVGTADPVSARVDGDMSLEHLRDFLLEVPGIPTNVAKQLGNVNVLQGALPIPLVDGYIKGEETKVNGNTAVKVNQPGMGAAFVWQQDNRIVGVAGTYDVKTVQNVSEHLAD